MSVQSGLFTWRQQAGAVSQVITLPGGQRTNVLWVMNEDVTNTIWIKFGDEIGGNPVAVADQVGAGGSFPLAPGESLPLPGLQISRIAFIAAAGTPYFKGLTYRATGQGTGGA